ncbi:MAG: tetratricopeptide repeat protein [Kofleriaceae bacterium]
MTDRDLTIERTSKLRDAGKADEAVAILAQAIADDPHFPPFHAFLALALMTAGHPRAALATMLGCALDLGQGSFGIYEHALSEAHRELLG